MRILALPVLACDRCGDAIVHPLTVCAPCVERARIVRIAADRARHQAIIARLCRGEPA